MFTAVILFNLCIVMGYTNAITDNGDNEWMLDFNHTNINQLEMGSSISIVFYAHTNTSWKNEDLKVQVISSDEDVAYTKRTFFDLPKNYDGNTSISVWAFAFNLTTEFLGYTKLNLRVVEISKLSLFAISTIIMLSIKILFQKIIQ